jgi:hypothetical protein
VKFKDHFSGHAASYAEARPGYPEALFEFLSGLCLQHKLAWDCATGNGQAAVAMARHFQQVIATDASTDQLEQAQAVPNIEYRQGSGECGAFQCYTGFSGSSGGGPGLTLVRYQLIFRQCRSSAETWRRVCHTKLWLKQCRCGGRRSDPTAVLRIVGPYWPLERQLVETRYADIDFPFTPVSCPPFQMSLRWSRQQLQQYLLSWSAVQRYIAENGSNPLDLIATDLQASWGDERVREVVWPLTVIVRRK